MTDQTDEQRYRPPEPDQSQPDPPPPAEEQEDDLLLPLQPDRAYW